MSPARITERHLPEAARRGEWPPVRTESYGVCGRGGTDVYPAPAVLRGSIADRERADVALSRRRRERIATTVSAAASLAILIYLLWQV